MVNVWKLLTWWLWTKIHTRAHVVAKYFSVIPRPRKKREGNIKCINCTINKVTNQGGSVYVQHTYDCLQQYGALVCSLWVWKTWNTSNQWVENEIITELAKPVCVMKGTFKLNMEFSLLWPSVIVNNCTSFGSLHQCRLTITVDLHSKLIHCLSCASSSPLLLVCQPVKVSFQYPIFSLRFHY